MELNWADCVGHPEALLDALGESTGDCYILYDVHSDLIRFSRNMLRIGGLRGTACTLEEWRSNVDGRDLERLKAVTDRLFQGKSEEYDLNYRLVTAQGQSIWVNSRGRLYPGRDGSGPYVLGRLSREGFSGQIGPFRSRELKEEIGQVLRSLQPGYLLLVGVDNFKAVNLKNGREYGDALLKDVVRVLRDEAGRARRVYRVSGDWFAVNLPGQGKGEVEQLFRRIRERLSGRCTVSGGAVSYTDYHVSDESMLLQYAEVALDHAKSHGKNTLSFFLPENYEERLRMLELREDLQKSVSEGFDGFFLVYQPQVRTETYQLYGAEVLLRYVSPRLGPVSPGEFIPILEQSGLICPVGMWVLEQSLAQCRQWRERIPGLHISVNMSYSQLNQDAVRDDVLEAVRRSGLPGEAVTIEVTESMQLMDYPHLNDIFRSWKKAGMEISVDDFGTGYSSLARLKDMEVDEIKIDRCFVRDIQSSAYNYRLLSNIVELADSSGIRVCCEGVETREELAVLEELQPALLQGFLFSVPVTAQTFQRLYLQDPGPLLGREEKEGQGHLHRREELPSAASEEEIARLILNAENDIFYLSDLDTYELYYLNPAGQKLFGIKDYQGRKCYKVLHGENEPCDFCTNSCLRQDSFFVWEKENRYCARRFLLKDKLVTYRGRKARLEVALDITKQEYVSQAAGERLAFAEKIVGYLNTLARPCGYQEAVNQALASVGEFYQADRAYLFEPSGSREGYWDNTAEWCAANITPQRHNLQNVSPQALERWMKRFEQDESIVILNMDPLQESAPIEWEILQAQGIQRLIAVPIRDEGKVIGFVGVDNPHYSIHNDAQVRVLASFLLLRIRQERSERRCQDLLRERNG